MKAKGKRILVVDDDSPILRTLRRSLIASGFEALVAENGSQALTLFYQHQPDLILLDLCLPGGVGGLDVCVQVRESSGVPIIILSAMGEEKQKIRALDLGADDYLTKPFSQEELQARVRACLRRSQSNGMPREQEPEVFVTEDEYLRMDVGKRQVLAGLQEIRLTPTEFELLRQLMFNAGRVLTHKTLLKAVWGPEYGEEADYLRVYIRQLRLKVEPEPSHPRYILTDPGVGYVFRMHVETPKS